MKRNYLIASLIIVGVTAGIMSWMGQPWFCECGSVKLWHGIVQSSENSQQLFDWYTFTHIVHGLGFYLLLSLLARRLTFAQKLLIAIGLESAWEIIENTDWVINYYRSETISLDYYGDSILNSIGDILAMAAGFWYAAKQKIWLSIALFLILETVLLFVIRDNLILNIVMFIYPFEAIKNWQLH